MKTVYLAYADTLMTPIEVSEDITLKYPLIDVKINDDIKYPIYDWKTNEVIEADANNQAKIIGELKLQNEELKSVNDDLKKQLKDVTDTLASLTEVIVNTGNTEEKEVTK